MNYSQEEFNQILLSKPLNEFYLAIIENRGEILTDEEFDKITKIAAVYTGVSKEKIDSISEIFQEKLNKVAPDINIMKFIYSFAQIRHMAIITVIDDEVYDIGCPEFVDLKRNKIIHFDNLTNYYDETNARIRFFTPEEEPQIKQKTVLLDIDDESIIYAYEKAHIQQRENEDLTSSFFTEVKGKPYTLSREPGNN